MAFFQDAHCFSVSGPTVQAFPVPQALLARLPAAELSQPSDACMQFSSSRTFLEG